MAKFIYKPEIKRVADLAQALQLSQDSEGKGYGRAVFLIGAGCSVSAGIPPASGVAQQCALRLANTLSRGSVKFRSAYKALRWLHNGEYINVRPWNGKIPKQNDVDWGALYQVFFGEHFNSNTQQKEIISDVITAAKGELNWTHICLGELVKERYAHTVLTTNFDHLVLSGIIRAGLLPVIADSVDSLNRIDSKPRWPQIVHLHGSMHAYATFNTPDQIRNLAGSDGASHVIFSLLKDANLLVVVGYSGNDEGVMKLLEKSTQALPNLVIYWVSYSAYNYVAEKAKSLMSGGNKFFIFDGESDQFFFNLLRELKVGLPGWVRDPIGQLQSQNKLNNPPKIARSYARVLVDKFKSKIDFAVGNQQDENTDIIFLSAVDASLGKYEEAMARLEPITPSTSPKQAKLHAEYYFELYNRNPEKHTPNQFKIQKEFEDLLSKFTGIDLAEVIYYLARITWTITDELDKSEQKATLLKKIVSDSDGWRKFFDKKDYRNFWSQINYFRALALQALGEDEETISDEAQRLHYLLKSEMSFNEVLQHVERNGDPDQIALEAKAGLAAVLQILGEMTKNVLKLRKAVKLLSEVEQVARTNADSEDDAGRLINLANAHYNLATHLHGTERKKALQEARTTAVSAKEIYETEAPDNMPDGIDDLLADIGKLLKES